MTHVTADPSRPRTHHGRIGRAQQHVAALVVAITAALALTIGCSLPAQAVESHAASAAATAHITAAEARGGAAITAAAVTTGDGTSTTLTPTDPGVKDPHALGASAKWAGWDRHGPWVDVSKDAWPIIAASGGAGATVRFCAIAKIGPFLCFLGVIAIAAVTEWVKHHPPCPGDQKFKFYFGDTPSYCHD